MITIKDYFAQKKLTIKNTLNEKGIKPKMAAIQVGNNEASNRYLKNKKNDCQEVGIDFHWYYFNELITTDELIKEIRDLEEFYDGIMVQMPLPDTIDTKRIKEAINPEKDVDGFHPMSKFNPCTPLGIINYLRDCRSWDFEGKNVVILGRSDIVGKPLARIMTDLNSTVTLCHSKTKGRWAYIKNADLVVCAVGQPQFLNCYSIHVPVIDVGINFDENGKLCGDCFNTENRDVTPVPGGVGLLTRLAMLENICKAAGVEI